MARATLVKKARKDVPGTNIKAGDSYYWWKFRRGGKHYSKTPPRRSQLTQSSFYAALWDIEDEIAALPADPVLQDSVEDIIGSLEELRDECQSSLDNMPEGLQQGPTGDLLQERIDAVESAISDLEQIDFEFTAEEFDESDHEREDDETEDEHTARVAEAREQHEQEQVEAEDSHWQEKLEEVQNVTIDAP